MRPEGTDAGGYSGPDPADADFVPWRPGDPTTAGEAPPAHTGREADVRRGVNEHQAHVAATSPPATGTSPSGRWWTEDRPERIETGHRVRNTTAAGTGLFDVPAGTRGQVTETRHTLLGGELATVRFEDGRTREVPATELRRMSWWDA